MTNAADTPSPPSAVQIPRPLLARITSTLQSLYPNEGCGLLTGRRQGALWRIDGFHPAANIHAEPARHFELDPAAHFALLRRLRQERAEGAGARDILGHVHSHPDSPAIPSAQDQAMAHDPNLLWLIVHTSAPPAIPRPEPTAQAWFPKHLGTPHAAFSPLPLSICEETGSDF